METFIIVLIIIGAIVLWTWNSIRDAQHVKCFSCNWVGTRERWNKVGHCPSCGSDILSED